LYASQSKGTGLYFLHYKHALPYSEDCMSTCQNCHQPVDNNQHFCSNCGTELTPQQEPLQPLNQPSYTLPASQPFTIAPGLLGPSADPAQVQPTNFVQRLLLTNANQLATNPIAGAILGAVVALLSCILLTVIAFIIVLQFSQTETNNLIDFAQILSANFLSLIAIEHGTSIVATTLTISLPLTLLLAIPAISCVAGGYVAAATDYSNDLHFAIGRAASMGPIYGLLLAIITAAFGSQDILGISYGPSFGATLFYGVLWGTLFGMIGGLIKISGRTWRPDLIAHVLSKPRGPFTAGIIGGLTGVGFALLLALPLAMFLIGGSLVSSQINSALTATDASSVWKSLLSIIILSPMITVWLLGFASGSNVDLGGSFSLFGSPTTTNHAISLLNPETTTALINGPGRVALYLLFLLPIIAYYYGGRIAARILGVSQRDTLIQAVVIAGVTEAIIMVILANMTAISININLSSVIQSENMGLNPIGVFFCTLIIGCSASVFSAYHYRTPEPGTPQAVSNNPLFRLFDRIALQLNGAPLRQSGHLLYSAIAFALIDAVIFIMLMVFTPILVSTIDFTLLTSSFAVISGILLAIPTLFAILSLATDLVSITPEPSTWQQTTSTEVETANVSTPLAIMSDSLPPSTPAVQE
jgi:hypothetical protein